MSKSESAKNIKAVIFDFDGTIADSFKVFIDALQTVIKRRQLTASEISDLRKSSLQEIIKKLGVKKWQLPWLATKGRREIGKHMDGVEAFDGMPEIIKELSRLDYKLYILSTNAAGNITDFLEKYKLSPYITRTYGNIGLRGKVKSLKKLRKNEGFSAAECLYIGDETRDIEAATKTHTKCIAVTWGFSNPETLKSYKPSTVVDKPRNLVRAVLLLSDRWRR